jgi:hypothetical protein
MARMRRTRSSRVRQRSHGSPALAVFLEREQIASVRIGFEVVEIGNGACGVPERGVASHVVDPFRAYIDGAAVAHAFELFLSAD